MTTAPLTTIQTLDDLIDQTTGMADLRAFLMEQGVSPTCSIYLDRVIEMWLHRRLGMGYNVRGSIIDGPQKGIRFPTWLDAVQRCLRDHRRKLGEEHAHPYVLLWRIDYSFNHRPEEIQVGQALTVYEQGFDLDGTITAIGNQRYTIMVGHDPLPWYCTWFMVRRTPNGDYGIGWFALSRS